MKSSSKRTRTSVASLAGRPSTGSRCESGPIDGADSQSLSVRRPSRWIAPVVRRAVAAGASCAVSALALPMTMTNAVGTTERAQHMSSLLLQQLVDQLFDMPLDGVSRRPIAPVLGYIVPVAGFARRNRVRRQGATDSEDDGRLVHISLADRRRLVLVDGQPVFLQPLHRADRESGLR